MREKLLTVIVPVFNDEANITRCLESLFNQTFVDMEIIVVNDASTDNTSAVLDSYQKTHQFQVLTMEQNSSAGCCRNIGIRAACTPFVTFVDSDDWVDLSTYTKCFEQISDNPDIIVFGLVYDYVTHNRREEKYVYSKAYRLPGDFALKIYAHTAPNEIQITPIVNNKVYRKKFLVDSNIFFHEELRYQEDDVFTFEALARASKVTFVSNCTYHYCQRPDSLIHNISELSIRSFIDAYLVLAADLKSWGLFERYKEAYFLKLKGSLLGVVKRVLDYEMDARKRLAYLSTYFVKDWFRCCANVVCTSAFNTHASCNRLDNHIGVV